MLGFYNSCIINLYLHVYDIIACMCHMQCSTVHHVTYATYVKTCKGAVLQFMITEKALPLCIWCFIAYFLGHVIDHQSFHP